MRSRCISMIENEASSSNSLQVEKKYSDFSLFLKKKSRFKRSDKKHILKQFRQSVKMNKRIILMN